MKVSIGRAAKELGVTREILRRWEASGQIRVERAPNGRRRYDLESIRRLAPSTPAAVQSTVAYARVSSSEQSDMLARQVSLLESFCSINGWKFEVITDVGSGVNYHNRGLKDLIRRICAREVSRLVVTHKDRLLRFGSELVFALCEQFETEVVIINAPQLESREEELVADLMETVKVFSSGLYGANSGEVAQVLERLTETVDNIVAGSAGAGR